MLHDFSYTLCRCPLIFVTFLWTILDIHTTFKNNTVKVWGRGKVCPPWSIFLVAYLTYGRFGFNVQSFIKSIVSKFHFEIPSVLQDFFKKTYFKVLKIGILLSFIWTLFPSKNNRLLYVFQPRIFLVFDFVIIWCWQSAVKREKVQFDAQLIATFIFYKTIVSVASNMKKGLYL